MNRPSQITPIRRSSCRINLKPSGATWRVILIAFLSVLNGCGWFLLVSNLYWLVLGSFGCLRLVLDGFGWFWVVCGFSSYVLILPVGAAYTGRKSQTKFAFVLAQLFFQIYRLQRSLRCLHLSGFFVFFSCQSTWSLLSSCIGRWGNVA